MTREMRSPLFFRRLVLCCLFVMPGLTARVYSLGIERQSKWKKRRKKERKSLHVHVPVHLTMHGLSAVPLPRPVRDCGGAPLLLTTTNHAWTWTFHPEPEVISSVITAASIKIATELSAMTTTPKWSPSTLSSWATVSGCQT